MVKIKAQVRFKILPHTERKNINDQGSVAPAQRRSTFQYSFPDLQIPVFIGKQLKHE